MTDLNAIANIPEKIIINGKEYSIKAPSIGVSALIARKMRELLELTDLTYEKLQGMDSTELFATLWKSIYDLFTTEKAEKAVDIASEIIAMLLNNKPLTADDLVVTPEDVKWNIKIDELTPLLAKVLHMADLMPFFVNMLKMSTAYDIEGILSGSQNSSSQSPAAQDGQ